MTTLGHLGQENSRILVAIRYLSRPNFPAKVMKKLATFATKPNEACQRFTGAIVVSGLVAPLTCHTPLEYEQTYLPISENVDAPRHVYW